MTADVSRGNASAAYNAPSNDSASWKNTSTCHCPSTNEKARKAGKLKVKFRTAKSDFPGWCRPHQGVHPRRRRFPGGPFAALRRRSRRRQFPGLSRAAHRQSQPLHVLPALRAGWNAGRPASPSSKRSKGSEIHSWPARRPSCWSAFTRARSSTVPSRARGRAAPPKPRTTRLPKRCCTTRKSAPST